MLTSQDIPVAIIFRAMGFCSDQLIMQMIGIEEEILRKMISSIDECYSANVFTQTQALRYDYFLVFIIKLNCFFYIQKIQFNNVPLNKLDF